MPVALDTLNSGATATQLDAHERTTGFPLPAEVREWYQWRNGQKPAPDASLLFGDELLSLEGSATAWARWQGSGYTDLNEEIAEGSTSKPPGAIIAAYTTPGWIPLARSPGQDNFLGVDLNPGPAGTRGQALYFGRDVQAKCVLGASFADFLEFLVEEMESGRVKVFDVNEGDDRGDEVLWTAHELCPPDLAFEALPHRLHDLKKFDGRRLHVDKEVIRKGIVR